MTAQGQNRKPPSTDMSFRSAPLADIASDREYRPGSTQAVL
jgi:hypothetical protein